MQAMELPKIGSLREACNIFINAMLDNDSLALVRFDDPARTLEMGVTAMGPPVLGTAVSLPVGISRGRSSTRW